MWCCLLRDKSGTGQVTLQGCWTTGGQKEPQSGNPGTASDQEADNLCDGATVSRKQRGDYGTERLVTNRWRLDAEGYILQWMDEAS
ncbi:hypothetical protein ElyMa_006084200 [Elysia marginata]|uniref:Uncharacterized protein n=1 Tax=Elysia marginata TaxID=1093978 RepID=A0AAV4GQD1_9GAST|nr:hypothetical protein ElyMa_006084200 [Elysia marginata]